MELLYGINIKNYCDLKISDVRFTAKNVNDETLLYNHLNLSKQMKDLVILIFNKSNGEFI